MTAASPIVRAVAQYIASQTDPTEIALGYVQAVVSGQPTSVSLGNGRVLSQVRTLNADTYTVGDTILVALLNRPVALGKVIENTH